MNPVSFTLDVGQRRQAAAPTVRNSESGAATPPASTATAVTTAARTLALAHFIDREIQAGRFKGCKDAAQRLGVSETRVNHVVRLLLLPPAVQAAVLLNLRSLSERELRKVAHTAEWPDDCIDAATRQQR